MKLHNKLHIASLNIMYPFQSNQFKLIFNFIANEIINLTYASSPAKEIENKIVAKV